MGLQKLRWLAASAGLLVVALIALIIVTAVLVSSANRTVQAVREQNAYNVELPQLRALLVELLNAETGQRGYLLTGRIDYLKPYEEAVRDLEGKLGKLHFEHDGEPQKHAQLARVRELIRLKLREMAQTIRLHDRGRQEAALEVVLNGTGEHYMTELRDLLESMINRWRSDRDVLGAHVAAEADQARWLLLAAVSLLVVFLGAAMFQVVVVLRQNGLLLRKLDREATHDALTGLPNRRYLAQWLSHCVGLARRGERELAVLFIDLDGFKRVNDHGGHETGDRLLRCVSTALSDTLRPSEFLSRLGGDEFAIVCSDAVAAENLRRLAERLIAEVALATRSAGNAFSQVGASIGIARFPEDGTDADALLNAADTAMYAAKSRGRGQACFAAELHGGPVLREQCA